MADSIKSFRGVQKNCLQGNIMLIIMVNGLFQQLFIVSEIYYFKAMRSAQQCCQLKFHCSKNDAYCNLSL